MTLYDVITILVGAAAVVGGIIASVNLSPGRVRYRGKVLFPERKDRARPSEQGLIKPTVDRATREWLQVGRPLDWDKLDYLERDARLFYLHACEEREPGKESRYKLAFEGESIRDQVERQAKVLAYQDRKIDSMEERLRQLEKNQEGNSWSEGDFGRLGSYRESSKAAIRK